MVRTSNIVCVHEFVSPDLLDLGGMGAVSEFMKSLKADEILFLTTLPIMVVIVVLSFLRVVPNTINFCATRLSWMFP